MDLSLAKWKDVLLETRLGLVVSWMCGGSRHEVTDVVLGQEVLDTRVTAPPQPELVKAGGKSAARRIVRVTAPPCPELVEAGERSVAGLHLGRN